MEARQGEVLNLSDGLGGDFVGRVGVETFGADEFVLVDDFNDVLVTVWIEVGEFE